jgi:hypothetical protein
MLNVKLSLELAGMPAGIRKGQLHTFFSLALGRRDRSGARSGPLFPQDITIFNNCVTVHLALVEEKNLLPLQGIEHRNISFYRSISKT